MSFRELGSADIDRLVALDAELFGSEAWPASTWWAELAQRPRREYLGWATSENADSGEVTAYGGLDHAGEAADIMTVAVAPQAQGRGLGALLLAELERRAGQRGAGAGLLEVRADNTAARALYEASGWRQLHVRARYYQADGVDAIVMGKSLAARGPQEGTEAR